MVRGRAGLAAAVGATVALVACGHRPAVEIARSPSPSPPASASLSQSPSPSPSPSPAPSRSRTPAPPRAAPPRKPAAPKPPAARGRCEVAPAASTGGPGRRPTVPAPLDLMVTGDSMPEFAGPQLVAMLDVRNEVAGCVEIHYSTGLVRPDFFDWPRYARQLMARRDPEAVVFMAGGNDGQNMLVNGRAVQAGSAEWKAEYRRRAEDMMRTFRANGKRSVYWIGMPSARSARLHGIYRVLNAALADAAAAVPGVRYVDIWRMFTTSDGRYADRLSDEYGRVQLMRGKDGIHLSRDGALFLARTLTRRIDSDWQVR